MIEPDFIIGQKVVWRSSGEIGYIYAWREIAGVLQIQLHPRGPFWSLWFFNAYLDGNDIMKELCSK